MNRVRSLFRAIFRPAFRAPGGLAAPLPGFSTRKFLLAGILLAGGCNPEHSDWAGTTPTPEEINEARFQLELADVRAGTRQFDDTIPIDPEREKAEARKAVEDSMRRIGERADPDEQDRHYAELVRQLIVESRFDEAALVCGKIHRTEMKDPLFEDIVRFRMKEIFEMFWRLPPMPAGEGFDGEIRDLVRQAVLTNREIADPLRRAESFGNIALFCLTMKDREGAIQAMHEAATSLQSLRGDDVRKARGFCYLTRWFLRQGEHESAVRCCDEAEAAAMEIGVPAAETTVLLEISTLRTLLGDDDGARGACDRAGKMIPRIGNPDEKAAALIRFADATLINRMKERMQSHDDSLRKIKKTAREAAALIDTLPDERPAPVANEAREEEAEPSFSEVGLFETGSNPVSLPRKELLRLKNELLRKIATIQAWSSPLEEVWDTILDIDEGPVRDDALVATVEMMISTGATEDAEAWIEEISDPMKRQAALRKLAAATRKR